jgi:transcriptional regulator with XRE-family HTH domain
MGRRAIPSNSLLADVRRHFGISQAGMAGFLGISQGQLANIEAGRRGLSTAALLRLNPLAALMPETSSEEPLAEALPLPVAPTATPLEARRDFCAWKARNLRYELRGLLPRVVVARRWQTALPALLAALPPAAPDPAPPGDWSRLTYPRELAQLWATAFTPDDAARYHLLRLQAEALETEAAALAKLLGGEVKS